MFTLGKSYTRAEIRAELGGGLQSCFLTANRRVVGICLRKDLNPEAPTIVLVGRGKLKERAAERLVGQNTPIPAFVKSAVNDWRYVGTYSPTGTNSSKSEIEKHAKRSGRINIATVLSLKQS